MPCDQASPSRLLLEQSFVEGLAAFNDLDLYDVGLQASLSWDVSKVCRDGIPQPTSQPSTCQSSLRVG